MIVLTLESVKHQITVALDFLFQGLLIRSTLIIFCRVLAQCKHPNASLTHPTKIQNPGTTQLSNASQLNELTVFDQDGHHICSL